MAKLDASAVATLLIEIGRRLVLAGENPYKARAYSRAAQNLLTLTLPLGEVIAAGRLREIPGVGEALAATIEQLYARGTTPKLEALRAAAPAGVLEMLRIPGLSPQKVRQIHKTLGIENLADLETACHDGRVRTAKGLGPGLETKILTGIELLRRSGGLRLIHHAGQLLEAAEFNLRRSHPELKRIALAGDYRRGCELVSDLAIVAQTPEPGTTRAIELNGEIRLWLADQKRYGAALLFATGSREHLQELQEIAKLNGLQLTDTGLLRGKRIVPTETEEHVYGALNLPFIPPELREGEGEVALARARRLPELEGVDLDEFARPDRLHALGRRLAWRWPMMRKRPGPGLRRSIGTGATTPFAMSFARMRPTIETETSIPSRRKRTASLRLPHIG